MYAVTVCRPINNIARRANENTANEIDRELMKDDDENENEQNNEKRRDRRSAQCNAIQIPFVSSIYRLIVGFRFAFR